MLYTTKIMLKSIPVSSPNRSLIAANVVSVSVTRQTLACSESIPNGDPDTSPRHLFVNATNILRTVISTNLPCEQLNVVILQGNLKHATEEFGAKKDSAPFAKDVLKM
jgi:hypothetical protein